MLQFLGFVIPKADITLLNVFFGGVEEFLVPLSLLGCGLGEGSGHGPFYGFQLFLQFLFGDCVVAGEVVFVL